MKLQQRVWKYCRDRDLIRPGDIVVIGVSGGPDSLCLLDILASLAPRQRLTLHVAHVNHGLRPESAGEANFVREQSEKMGLAFHLETVHSRFWAEEHKESVEEAARHLRYAYLGAVAQKVGAGRVAVGHTQDDQAETVLMHFLRGSGLAGLAGMEPKRIYDAAWWKANSPDEKPESVDLIRPLLDVTRADVLAYCVEAGLEPRFDPSNLDPAYFRNRLRYSLLPELETYNPNIRAALARSAEAVRGDVEWHREAVEALWRATALPLEDAGLAVFQRDRWLQLSEAQQRALLRMGTRQLLGGLRDVDYRPIAAAARFSRAAAPGRSCEVTGGLMLEVSANEVRLVNAALPRGWADGQVPLAQPDGRLAAGWRLETQVVAAADWREADGGRESRWMVSVDGDRLTSPVTIRARRRGDRFAPLGMDGRHMKLSDFMINIKLPAALRNRWPLLVSGDDIVWVAGLRLNEHFRVRADTQQIVRLALIGPERSEDE
jgi:tRNA(Ile)-lysidine synthetase-like protein